MSINLAVASPAGFARHASNGHWKAAPHLLLLNRVLMAAAAGEEWALRVIIQMPPRHGKSELVSGHFPAWYLGMYPNRKVVLASYEHDLAASWGQKNRDLLEAYGPSLFNVRIRHDTSAKNRWSLQHKRGGMFTAGIGGPLTGKGGNMLIIDDPIKNDQEALSPTYREKHKSWYRSTLRTRLESSGKTPGAIIVIQTRWHEDDLAGWLQTESDEKWLVISLPAIAEKDECIYLPDDPDRPAWTRKEGEALWPSMKPLASLQEDMRAQGGEKGHWWLALYQQRPNPLGGGILKPEQFRHYTLHSDGKGYLLDTPAGPRLVSSGSLRKFVTMDLATSVRTQADYSVVGVFALAGPDLLVLDILRNKWEGPDLPKVAARVYEAYHPAYLGVESVGFQLSTVQDMRRGNPHEVPPRRGLPIKPLRPQGDKISRALTLSARMDGGNIYVLKGAKWLPALESEVALFPKGEHDDQVDVLSYAALEQVGFGDNTVKGS